MTQEEKLLLKDLCARVPYHPKGHVVNACNGSMCDEWLTCATFPMFTNIINNCRLYLRPMSSMTEEEKKDYELLCDYYIDDKEEKHYFNNIATIDWYHQKHFDCRGLIKLGLAIEAPEGMYK